MHAESRCVGNSLSHGYAVPAPSEREPTLYPTSVRETVGADVLDARSREGTEALPYGVYQRVVRARLPLEGKLARRSRD